MKLSKLLPMVMLALGVASASAQTFNTSSTTGWTTNNIGTSQPVSFWNYTGPGVAVTASGGSFVSATGAGGFLYNNDAAAAAGSTVTESAALTLGSDAQDNTYGGGYQSGVVTLQLWSGPSGSGGTSMAVLALYGMGGTSYNAQINGTNSSSTLTINPTDALIVKIVDNVGGGTSGQDALTATISDNGTTIYTANLNVTTSSDGAYSFRMLNGPTTIKFTNLALGVSSGTTYAFNTATNTGWTTNNIGTSQPVSFWNYTGPGVNVTASGGSFVSATGAGGFLYNSDIAASSGNTVTESTTLTLGSDAQDNTYGGGYQDGVVTLQLWTGPSASSGTSMAVLALYGMGGTSYNAQLNGTNSSPTLTINPTDTLIVKIADNVGGGTSGQDALTATISDNGTTIYTANLNVTTSSDGAYSYRMLNGPTTIKFTALSLGVSGSGGGGGGGITPVITSSATDGGTTGTAFSYQITANNSPTSYSVTGSLPSGLSLNGSSGAISGTPTTPGAVAVTINATNSTGTGSQQLILAIASPGIVSVSGGSSGTPGMINNAVAVGTTGQSFTYEAKASNAPYTNVSTPPPPVTTFSASGLPSGLSIANAETSGFTAATGYINTWEGLITGTPTTAGTYAATITATNGSGSTTVPLLFVIQAPTTSGAFYTTYKDGNGVWWFKDPTGALIVSKAMDSVIDGPIASEGGGALDASLLLSDNINTIGAWSSYNFIPIPGSSKNMGYTGVLNASDRSVNGFPDVFASAFTSEWTSGAQGGCGQFSSDHSVIGWYSDNELDWGYEWTPGTGEDNNGIVTTQLLWSFLGATSSATYSHALSFLQNEYGTGSTGLANLNSSWQTSFTAWSQLGQGSYSSSNSTPSHTGVYNDCNNFAAVIATQYFSVVKTAIKNADPNHLILGCRFASQSHPLPAVVATEANYVDVISCNCYQSDTYAPNPISDVQYYYSNSGSSKPVIIGEFSFCSTAQNNSNCPNTESAVNEPTQAARATGFQTYVQDGMSCKALIGYSWFLMTDWEGDCDYGVTDITNTAYSPINSQMTTTNASAETLHASANQ